VRGTRQQRARGGSGQTREEGGQVGRDDPAAVLVPVPPALSCCLTSAGVRFISFQKLKFEKDRKPIISPSLNI
jgi:hypothetical protein